MNKTLNKICAWIIALAMVIMTLVGAVAVGTAGNIIYYTKDNAETNATHTEDISASLNHGIISGATTNSSGIINEGFLYVTNDYVQSQSNTGISGADERTINAWINYTGGASDYIFCIGNTGTRNWFALIVDATHELDFSSYADDYDSGETITQNAWSQVTATYNGTHVRTYLNGVETAVSNQAIALTTTASSLYIGDRCDLNGDRFEGHIDEVSVYNRTWTPAEVNESYNAGAGENPYVGTGYFEITINNENTFNATINGTEWTATNGTITTNHTEGTANITIYSNNYYNKTYTDQNLTEDITTSLDRYPIINSYNAWNGSKIITFNVTINNITYQSNSTGDVHTPTNWTVNVTTTSNGYVSQVDEISLSANGTHNTSDLYQSIVRLNSTEITTGNPIINWELSTEVGNFSTSNGTIIIRPNIANHTWNWTTDNWYFNVTGLNIPIDQSEENLTLNGFWARNITFVNNLTGTPIEPNCEQDGTNYTSTDYLMPNSTSTMTCTLTGFMDTTFTLNSTPDSSEYRMEPAMLWLIFDQSTTGYVETEDCTEYEGNCESFNGTSVYIQQSNLSIGRVSVKFNPDGGNTSDYQQVFEYDNNNNTHIKEYIKIIVPDLVQQVKVTGERSPIEEARVTVLNLGTNPDTNNTDWLTVFADFTNTDGFATVEVNDQDTYKFCAQATGYTTKCEIHYIAPASTDTILMDLTPTATTEGHNFIATSCPNYYVENQSCVLEVNTYQSYNEICINYTSEGLNTTSCDSNSVTKSWAYSITELTGNITIEVFLDGTSAQNITHQTGTYNASVMIDFESNEMADGDTFMEKLEDEPTYLVVVYILLTIIGVAMGFMAEKYFEGYGLYGSGVWFLVLAIGKLYIFWIPVIVVGVHAIIYRLVPLFQNR